MFSSYFRFRFQRAVRRYRRDVSLIRSWSRNYFHRHIWGKWAQLGIIRRFLVGWWLLLGITGIGLIFQTGQLNRVVSGVLPKSGGVWIEGVVGHVTNINPVLPEGSASSDINRLIYSGLVQINPKRGIEPDLALSWQISPDAKTYTFSLRPGVKWHDGAPFTARDVVFTLQVIQNPDTRSPLSSAWQGVKAEAKDDLTVVYTLPNPYAPFLYSLTQGIIPEHALSSVEHQAIRATGFNQHPIGTGPFKVATFLPSDREVKLDAYPQYHGGRPKLDGVLIKFFDSSAQALESYAKRQVMAVAKVPAADLAQADKFANFRLQTLNLPDQTHLFFKTQSGLLADKSIRQALVSATDRKAVTDGTLNGHAIPLYEPILPSQIGYNPKYKQVGYDQSGAQAMLDKVGWVKGEDGTRTKNGQPLRLNLVTLRGSVLEGVADAVAAQWQQVGVRVDIKLVESADLQQSYIRPRNYDVLLFSINIGGDPDVYSYWHSSQVKDPGLNLSEYSSPVADKALEGGRILTDPVVRRAKYAAFLGEWQKDNPSVVLYTANYYYGISTDLQGFKAEKLIEPSDRFYRTENWTIRSVGNKR